MKYEVQVDTTLVLEVADGTTSDEFYELFHNAAGVSLTATSGDEEKLKILSCTEDTAHVQALS